MVLNPSLYAALKHKFGEVYVTNENERRLESRVPGERFPEVIERGEHYNVCCPYCGDTRNRLSISYKWLDKHPFSGKLMTHLINCYNESCEDIRSEDFYLDIIEKMELADLGMLPEADNIPAGTPKVQQYAIPMPEGCVPIGSLPEEHEAIQFIKHKYNFNIRFIDKFYEVKWCGYTDPKFKCSKNRIIFPIRKDGELVAWQGRTIEADNSMRWFLPPGFVKCFYNGDMVDPIETPVITEGIPASIACGPKGICIFGKKLSLMRSKEFSDKWTSAIVATDPDTFVKDPKSGRIPAYDTKSNLERFINDVRLIRWPSEILTRAKRKLDGEDIFVPDPADIGMKAMKRLIEEAR